MYRASRHRAVEHALLRDAAAVGHENRVRPQRAAAGADQTEHVPVVNCGKLDTSYEELSDRVIGRRGDHDPLRMIGATDEAPLPTQAIAFAHALGASCWIHRRTANC